MRGFAQHPALDGLLTIRHLELRQRGRPAGSCASSPSDGPRVHGLSSHALHRRRGLGVARRRRAARGDADRPDQAPRRKLLADLHRRRRSSTARSAGSAPARSPSPRAKRDGAVVEARRATCTGSNGACPTTPTSTTSTPSSRRNPAPWITVADLRRQRAAVPDTRVRAVPRLPVGRRRGLLAPARRLAGMRRRARRSRDGEDVWIGVDVGGERSASAVVWVNAALHVGAAHLPRRRRRPRGRRPRPRARRPLQRPRAGLRPVAVRASRAGTRARRAARASRSRSTTRA